MKTILALVLFICIAHVAWARDVNLEVGGDGRVQQLSHFYGWVDVGSSSRWDLQIVNTDSKPLTFEKVALEAPGFKTDNACPATLAPKERCRISIDFRPRLDSRHSESLALGFAGGESVEVDLSGYGRRL